MEPVIEQHVIDHLIRNAELGLTQNEWVSTVDLCGTSVIFRIKNKYNILGRTVQRGIVDTR